MNDANNRAKYRSRYFFGGNRELAIQRDGERCVKCSMTRLEHREKYGRDLTVHHIDGKGVNSKEKNHDLGNLQTLCMSCHGYEDTKRAPQYDPDAPTHDENGKPLSHQLRWQRKMKALGNCGRCGKPRGEKFDQWIAERESAVRSATIEEVFKEIEDKVTMVADYPEWIYGVTDKTIEELQAKLKGEG